MSYTQDYVTGIRPHAYVECTVSGGVRNRSGSTNVVQEISPGSISWIGIQAASLFSNVFFVQDTSSLLTYTPAGATVTGLTTVTTNFAASSPTYGNSDTLITTPPTGTPSSTTGTRQGGAGQVEMDLGKIFSSAMVTLMILTIF
jgi:hypothetical protein